MRPTNELRMATISGRVELAKISRMGRMYSCIQSEERSARRRAARVRRTNLNASHTRLIFRLLGSTGDGSLDSSAAVVTDDEDVGDSELLNAVGDDGLDLLANVLRTRASAKSKALQRGERTWLATFRSLNMEPTGESKSRDSETRESEQPMNVNCSNPVSEDAEERRGGRTLGL